MNRPGRCCVILAALGLLAVPARAAVLIHEYALRGSLNDNLGGSPLASMGGQITALGYVFAANQGLSLTSSLLNAANYSIELSFRFNDTSGYRKIADFHNRADDTGFYQLSGSLNFFPVVTAGTADFTPNTDIHVVLTRDSTSNMVVGYVNGQQRFTFTDSAPLATLTSPDQKLILFADDFATGQGEASGGAANFVRIYNGPLTPSEVMAIYNSGGPHAVPEPSTLVLLGAGTGALLLGRRTRRSVP